MMAVYAFVPYLDISFVVYEQWRTNRIVTLGFYHILK
jgi:hypothetical protein